MNRISQAELLSPVGSMESLYAAVQNGCNAVYLGGKDFSARAYANNFSKEELETVCDYCHLRGVKVYVTVNTVYKKGELNGFLSFIDGLYAMGVDALIMQDLGAAMAAKEKYPDLPLHASTQLTANSLEDVEYLYDLGFSKVVLSRELTLGEVSHIASHARAQIETFIHGALCVSYSGQCLMSSMIGGRSGNRGRCAQTCRLPYSLCDRGGEITKGHLLSTKDMCTLAILPQLLASGVASFKIEGRMKNPEYVAGVTAIYRKYMDLAQQDPAHYQVGLKDEKILLQLFNRGGFTTGYYEEIAGADMMSVERPKTWGLKCGFVDQYIPKYHKVMIRTRENMVPGDGIEIWTSQGEHVGTQITKPSRAGEVITISLEGGIEKNDAVYKTFDKALQDEWKKTWQKDERKIPVWGECRAKIGESITFKLYDNTGNAVFVTGTEVMPAKNQPLSKEELQERLSKLGGTTFSMEMLQVDMDDAIYVGIKELNALRREAAERLRQEILRKSHRTPKESKLLHMARPAKVTRKKLSALVVNPEQFKAILKTDGLKRIYFEMNHAFGAFWQEALALAKDQGIELFAAMPQIERGITQHITKDLLAELLLSDIDGFLVRSGGQFAQVRHSGKAVVVDYTLNVTNEKSLQTWLDAGAEQVCLSPELNAAEIAAFAGKETEMLVYGYLPLMITQQCPIGNYVGGKAGKMYCSEKGTESLYFLQDRKGERFPLMPDCERCVCRILNGKPLFTLKFFDEVMDNGVGSVRLFFTKESGARAAQIARAYGEMVQGQKGPAAKELLRQMELRGSTKGHFFRGVE